MKNSEREKLKTGILKYMESLKNLRKFPDLYDTESSGYRVDLAGKLMVELFDEGRLDLGFSISKRDSKIQQDLENLRQSIRFIRSIDREVSMQATKAKVLLYEEYKAKRDGSEHYPVDIIDEFSKSLSRDYYDKAKAGRILGVSRQTIHNWLDKSHLGLKVELIGSRLVITKEEMIRYYGELSKEKLKP